MKVEVFNNQPAEVNVTELQQVAHKIWNREGKTSAEIGIILVDEAYIKKLNQKFFGKDQPTDVISFPYTEENVQPFEGEIYISVDTVFDNARRFRTSKAEELRRVVAHGILHLLGYRDHSHQEKQVMTSREDYYLS